MKIGLMIPTLLHGGAERAICRLSDILVEGGHEVFLIVFDASNQFYSYSGKLIDLKLANGNTSLDKLRVFMKRIKKVKEIKKKHNFDIVISYIAAATFVNVFTKYNEKCIVSQRNFLSKQSENKLKTSLLKYSYKKADAVIAVSELCRLDVIKTFKLSEEKIKTIYNAYEQEEIISKMKEEIDTKHKHFITSHMYNIISVGRAEYQKGFWNLIKVLYKVRMLGIDCGLTIVGQGNQLEKLINLSDKLNLKNHVQFVGYQSNPYAYIDKTDIYVMSSLFEGFPNALTEAMCCGKPIISTDCPSGPREILQGKKHLEKQTESIENCEYGILTPVFSELENWDESTFEYQHDLMANAIGIILKDNKLKAKLGAKAQERSREFSYAVCLNDYENLFHDLLS